MCEGVCVSVLEECVDGSERWFFMLLLYSCCWHVNLLLTYTIYLY